MAITTVELEFVATDSFLEASIEAEGDTTTSDEAFTTNTLLCEQDLGFYSLGFEGFIAPIPLIQTSLGSMYTVSMESDMISVGTGVLAKNVLQVAMEGSIATLGYGTSDISVLELRASGSMYVSKAVKKGALNVLSVSIEASGYIGSNLSMDKELVILSMEGEILQGVDEDGDIVIIPADDDAEYPSISGEEYIVVNLRTKTHTTYRDGERTALAKTASMNFGTYTLKSISDLFLLSRAKGPMEVVMNTKEDIERRYPLSFGETTQANLKNKKLPVAKGLRGSNWTISLVVPDDSHLEVRGMTLFVTDTERHN